MFIELRECVLELDVVCFFVYIISISCLWFC